MRADAETERAVLASLDRLTTLYAAGRIGDVLDLMVPDADITVVEAGLDEEYVGRHEIRAASERDPDEGQDDVPVVFKRRWVSASPARDVAWVTGEADAEIEQDGAWLDVEARFTGVAERRDGRWLWHTLHFSLPWIDDDDRGRWRPSRDRDDAHGA
jgi:hypothetical protein